jgi:5-methyltetrahydropteroyltriglutamate--homocysteine methyltransferase
MKELRSLADVGCTHLQLDETSLVKLGDARVRAILRDRGHDWSDLLDRYIEAMNAIAEQAPPGMKLAVHICRSQNPNWQANASYDPIAEKIFNALKFNVYFLEYDNANAGSFEPLRLVPPGKRVVLGLISTRVAEIENIDGLKRRIDEASRYIPLAQLAIGPQCGFSTNLVEGVHLTNEIQRAKLALIAAAAREIWPGG